MRKVIVTPTDPDHKGKYRIVSINLKDYAVLMGEPTDVPDEVYAFLTERIPVFSLNNELKSMTDVPRPVGYRTRFNVTELSQ
jgi:hypothetical protein